MARKKYPKFPFKLLAGLIALVGLNLSILMLNSGRPCANTLSCKRSLKLNVNNGGTAVYNRQPLNVPEVDLSYTPVETKVLGEKSITGEKHIYIDLTTQTLKAYEGEDLFWEAKTSTGKWYPTPTGDFTIWHKVRSTLMSGGKGADYYYLPNVEYVMFFYNSEIAQGRGFAIHGAYWHNNFGHAMSHGCINLRNTDAQKLYYWTDPPVTEKGTVTTVAPRGTKITIYGKAL